MDFNSFVESADEIIPGIWVGNQQTSQSAEFMRRNGIKLIVNATKTIPSQFLGKIYYVRVPVNDPGILGITQRANVDVESMKKSLPIVLPIIKKFYDKNIPILIHCHAGAQRSAIIAAAFLIKYGFAKTPKEAVSIMVEKRPIAFFGGKSVNFRAALE